MKTEEINIRISGNLKEAFRNICKADESTMSNKIINFIVNEVKKTINNGENNV